MNEELIKAALAKMEYRDGLTCCATCVFFVPTDCSGNPNAKSAHCERNAFDLPVSPAGYCREHKPTLQQ